jgi:hypothetical protein
MNLQRSEILATLVHLTKAKAKNENLTFVKLSDMLDLPKDFIELSIVLDYLWDLDVTQDDEYSINKMLYLFNTIIFKYCYFIELTKKDNPSQDLSIYTFFNILGCYFTPEEENVYGLDNIKNIAKLIDLLVDKFNGKLEKIFEKDLLDNDAAMFLATKLDVMVMNTKINIAEQIKQGLL